jgi:hypothetical protein
MQTCMHERDARANHKDQPDCSTDDDSDTGGEVDKARGMCMCLKGKGSETCWRRSDARNAASCAIEAPGT